MARPAEDCAASSRVPLFHGSLARGIAFACLVAPVLLAPVFSRDFFELSPRVMVIALAGNALPCWVVPLVVFAAYRLLSRRLLAHARTAAAQVIAHACMSGGAATVAALIIRPAMVLFSNRTPPAAGFVAACVAVTWAVVFPALVIERHQDRAAGEDRRLRAARDAARRAELEALRSRTRPHFLFNSLNTIASLIPDQPKLAEETVERLASVLRVVLSSSTVDAISLAREMEIVVDYLEVQKARFGDRLRYAIDLEPGLGDIRVPPLILQPLVENAVLHGLADRAEGGSVRISGRLVGPMLELAVHDDGRARGAARRKGSGTSLRDLRRRLEISYGPAARLWAGDADGRGFLVELSLPAGEPGTSRGAAS